MKEQEHYAIIDTTETIGNRSRTNNGTNHDTQLPTTSTTTLQKDNTVYEMITAKPVKRVFTMEEFHNCITANDEEWIQPIVFQFAPNENEKQTYDYLVSHPPQNTDTNMISYHEWVNQPKFLDVKERTISELSSMAMLHTTTFRKFLHLLLATDPEEEGTDNPKTTVTATKNTTTTKTNKEKTTNTVYRMISGVSTKIYKKKKIVNEWEQFYQDIAQDLVQKYVPSNDKSNDQKPSSYSSLPPNHLGDIGVWISSTSQLPPRPKESPSSSQQQQQTNDTTRDTIINNNNQDNDSILNENLNIIQNIRSQTIQTQMHYDVVGHHNLNFQFLGQKEILLFPPSNTRNVYCMPLRFRNLSRISNPYLVNLKEYPNYITSDDTATTILQPYNILLQPNEVLFIPAKWYHFITYYKSSSWNPAKEQEDTTTNTKKTTTANTNTAKGLIMNVTIWYESKYSYEPFTFKQHFWIPNFIQGYGILIKFLLAVLHLLLIRTLPQKIKQAMSRQWRMVLTKTKTKTKTI